jgi:hypothetical protein
MTEDQSLALLLVIAFGGVFILFLLCAIADYLYRIERLLVGDPVPNYYRRTQPAPAPQKGE